MNVQQRGQALETIFFAKQNQELLPHLQQELDERGQREALRQVTGIADGQLLDRLLAMEINAQTVGAMLLAPLVLVAWADGNLDPKEREAVMWGAEDAGIRPTSLAGRLLQGWLNERPSESLKQVWIDYTRAICSRLLAGEQVQLAEDVMGRCRRVAEAAGGFLGLGCISKSEVDMINQLQEAFD